MRNDQVKVLRIEIERGWMNHIPSLMILKLFTSYTSRKSGSGYHDCHRLPNLY